MKAYIALRNADMIEGKGLMVPDTYFLHKEHADDYVDSKPGVMGKRAKWLKENDFEIDYALNTEQYSYYHSMTDTRFAEVSSEYFILEDAEIEIKKEGK